jgi:O-antigen ligase
VIRSLQNLYVRKRLLPVQLGVFITFMLIPLWYRFPGMKALGMGDFTIFYSAGFLIFWPILWTIIWWVFSGLSGIGTVWKNKTLLLWLILQLIFAGWILLSWVWSYERILHPAVTVGAAIPFVLVIFFALALSCSRVPVRLIIAALVIGLLWNSLLASLQVAHQGSLGLKLLGEFQVDPASSGTVIVQAGDIRWLRPYGLLPHPNMLGGFLVIGLLAAFGWSISERNKYWLLGVIIFILGLWSLFLSFSRSAWLGLAVGLLLLLVFTFRSWRFDRTRLLQIVTIMGMSLVAGGLFFLLYQPFLSARAGIGDESVELRSVSDRNVYNQIAVDAIKKSPILGTGIGNFPWYSTDYLAKTPYDLRGQPVHNIYLSAWSELGIIGLALFLLIVGLAIRAGITNIKQRNSQQPNDTFLYATATCGVVAFLVIGFFDHYSWTLIQFQVAFWGLMAVAIQPPSTISELT